MKIKLGLKQPELFSVMTKRGYTQAKLSEQTGISRNSISNAYRGNPCAYDTIKKIATALQVDVSEILTEIIEV